MNRRKDTAPSSDAAFLARHAVALSEWGKSLASYRGPIVAISRKGPRLVELGVRASILPESLLSRVIAESGFFLDPPTLAHGEVPVLCDDIIIIGTTFQRLFEFMTLIYPDRRIAGLPYALSRGSKIDHSRFVECAAIGLADDACTSFVNAETTAFASLDKPYDLDHPIVTVPLNDGANASAVFESLKEVALVSGGYAYATPRRFTDAAGRVCERSAWSILFPEKLQRADQCGLRKIRCYLDANANCLRIVPIAPRMGTLSELQAIANALPLGIIECWHRVAEETAEMETDTHELSLARTRALITWASYLFELVDLLPSLARISRSMSEADLASFGGLSIESFDVQLLVGVRRASEVAATINRWLARPNLVQYPSTSVSPPARSISPVIPVIPDQQRTSYKNDQLELLVGCDDPTEILEAEFKAQHVGIELPGRTNDPPLLQRLEFGVPINYLWNLVSERCPSATSSDFHLSFDTLIDKGIIVPRFLPTGSGSSDVWFRSFRVGERQSEMMGNVARDCLEILGVALGAPVLPETLTEKFLVLSCEYAELFNDPSLSAETSSAASKGFERAFHLYGARPQVVIGSRSEWLIDWAKRRRIINAVAGGYQVNAEMNRFFRNNERSFIGTTRQSIKLLAAWTKEARDTNGLGLEFLIAITTVESDWAYKEALDAELRGWLHDSHSGYGVCLNAFDDLVRKRIKPEDVDARLASLANWYAQAKKKRVLRGAFDEYLNKANEKWNAQSASLTASVWTDILRPAIDRNSTRQPHPKNILTEVYEPVLRVIGRVTHLLRDILSQFTGVNKDRATVVTETVKEVCAAVAGLPLHLKTHFDAAIYGFEIIPNCTELDQAVAAMRSPIEIVAGAADWARNMYPNLGDEPFDVLEPGLFVLMWDVRGSSGEKVREPLTREVLELNSAISQAFKSHLHEFEPESTDDGHALVCDGFASTLAIAEFIVKALEGKHSVKMGCDTNSLGSLHRGRTSRKLGGKAFEYAARMMTLFEEIEKYPTQFTAPEGTASPKKPETGSYLVVSEEAFRLGELSSIRDQLETLQPLPGRYRARVAGSIPRDVYLVTDFKSRTAPNSLF